jgi:hypothetical protein
MKKPTINIPDVETLTASCQELLLLRANIEAEEARLTQAIADIKATSVAFTSEARQRASDLEKAITKHVSRHRGALMGEEKHLDLPRVRIGFRLSLGLVFAQAENFYVEAAK